jgi:hypothetical protein
MACNIDAIQPWALGRKGMNKKYQVFVSATFADLRTERQAAIQMLLKLNCIPVGMEFFTAIDEEQMKYIKRLIDDCDYYLLLIGGRYGSTSSKGISFTEMEYRYTAKRRIPVIAIVHGAPGTIPVKKTDADLQTRKRLEAFRRKVKKGRLVQQYTSAKEIPGLVAASMHNAIHHHPAVGWVRADRVATDPATTIRKVRRDNEELAAEVAALKRTKEAAEASAEFLRNAERAYLTGGGDVQGTHFRLEVANLGKSPAFLSRYDVRFKKLAAVQARRLPVRRRYRFNDLIAADNKTRVIDRIAMPPDTEIIFGAFWYQDTEKREHIFRFILRIAEDGHTRPDVEDVDGSYSHWD